MIRLPRHSLVFTAAFLDPAGGKLTKDKSRARSAIVVASVDPANRIFVRYSWAERCATERLYDKIYEVNRIYKPNVFGIEGNAQQGLFVDSVIKDAKKERIRIAIANVIHPTNLNKDFRIRTFLQPPVSEGRLFLLEDQTELLKEIVNFPMGRLKDMLDSLASAVSLLPNYFSMGDVDQDDQEYLQYLRDSGAPMDQIELEARKMHRDSPHSRTLESYIAMIQS